MRSGSANPRSSLEKRDGNRTTATHRRRQQHTVFENPGDAATPGQPFVINRGAGWDFGRRNQRAKSRPPDERPRPAKVLVSRRRLTVAGRCGGCARSCSEAGARSAWVWMSGCRPEHQQPGRWRILLLSQEQVSAIPGRPEHQPRRSGNGASSSTLWRLASVRGPRARSGCCTASLTCTATSGRLRTSRGSLGGVAGRVKGV